MATVIKNADNTLTVTPTAGDQKVLVRWAQDTGRSVAATFERAVNEFITNKRIDYRNADGPTKQDKYDALSPAVQAQVDALLG
jgi:hypothetical protein